MRQSKVRTSLGSLLLRYEPRRAASLDRCLKRTAKCVIAASPRTNINSAPRANNVSEVLGSPGETMRSRMNTAMTTPTGIARVPMRFSVRLQTAEPYSKWAHGCGTVPGAAAR